MLATVSVDVVLLPVAAIDNICDAPRVVPLVVAEILKVAPEAIAIVGELAIEPEPLRAKVPALIAVFPLYVFIPPKVRFPAPFFVNPNEAPLIIPPTVNVEPFMARLLAVVMETAPVPRFNACVPVKAKSPPQVIG